LSIQSTDSSVIRIDSAGTLARGDSATSVVATGASIGYFRVRYFGSGTARIRVTAPGFSPDSSVLITVTGPSLYLAYPTVTAGTGQIFQNEYVYVNNAVTTPLVVHLQRSDSAALPAAQVFGLSADSVIIPASASSAPAFEITGQIQASAQLIARATGYTQATATVQITQPKLALGTSASVVVGTKNAVTVSAQDANGVAHNVAQPLTVTLVSSTPAHTAFDSSTVTIPAGSYYAQTGVTFDTAGTYTISASALGYTGASAPSTATGALVTMIAPITFAPANVTINVGQYVTWKNADAITHTTTENSATPLWNASVLPGQTYSLSFGTAGTFNYHCTIHGTLMSGTVTVQ
jgi:plastocyanin